MPSKNNQTPSNDTVIPTSAQQPIDTTISSERESDFSRTMRLRNDLLSGEKDLQKNQELADRYASASLRTAFHTGYLLEGTVTTVDSNDDYAYLVLLYGDNEVRIPYAEHSTLLEPELVPGKKPALINRQGQMLRKLIGARITYSPVDKFQEGELTVILASRVKAMKQIQEQNFIRYTPVEKGQILEANILSVADGGMMITVAGVDLVLHVRQITNRWVEDLRLLYRAGETIRVQINDWSIANGKVELEVSAKDAEWKGMKARKRFIKPGRTYKAQIVYPKTIEDDITVYRLYLVDMDYVAETRGFSGNLSQFSFNHKSMGDNCPKPGQLFDFEVTGFNNYGIPIGYLKDRTGKR